MEAQIDSLPSAKKVKLDFKDSKYATGRRKKSTARVWLKKGSGNILINGKKIIDYFKKQNLQIAVYRPLALIKRENEFDIKGGGSTGQAGAIVHGIARALVELEPDLKPALKKEKLTTRDSRTVERKKYGRRKARRSFQFSKR